MSEIYDLWDKIISTVSPTISIEFPKILDAYFAKIKYTHSVAGIYTYTFGSTNNTSTSERKKKIASIILGKIKKELEQKNQFTTEDEIVGKLTEDSYSNNDDDKVTFDIFSSDNKIVSFERIYSANISQEVYIVAETKNFQGKKIQIKIRQGKERVIADVDKPIKVIQNGSSVQNIESIIGEFDEINDAKNKDDFKDWAIIKVNLRPKTDESLKKWDEAIDKTTDKKTYLYLLVDVETDNPDYEHGKNLVYYGRNPDENGKPDKNTLPNAWLDMERKWFEITTKTLIYDIYHDGKIHKNKMENPDYAKYIYHDKNGVKHNLGIAKAHKTRRHTKKDTLSTKKDNDTVLVYVKDIPSYNSGGVKFKFLTWNSSSGRWYINPDCLAGLLGAMIEENIVDLGFNGFSIKNGNTAGGSSSHINGEKGDLRYLNTNKDARATHLQHDSFDYERQVKFNNALHKFYWGRVAKMYSEKFDRTTKKEVIDPKTKQKVLKDVTETTLLPHTKHMKKTTGTSKYRHHHHLHLTGFDFSKIIEK